MPKITYITILLIFSIFPIIGIVLEDYYINSYGITKANIIHVSIFAIFAIFALMKISDKQSVWLKDERDSDKIQLILERIRIVLIICLIINFALGGVYIITGIGRGVVRTTLGYFGWLYSFNIRYCMPGLFSIATVFYFYFSDKNKVLRRSYIQIVVISLLIAAMTGYKSAVVTVCFAPLLQYSQLLNKKKIILFTFLALASITILGVLQRDVDISESLSYNIHRATNLAAFGTIGVWDFFPNGADEPAKTLWLVLGENLTSIFTGVERRSLEFLDYSLAKKITYQYYADYEGAILGTVNLTVTSFGEAVFWFGRKYYFLFSIMIGFIVYFMTLRVFKTRSYRNIIRNTMYTIYFTSVFVPWTNSATVANLFGITTLFYLMLLYLILKYITRFK